MSAPVELHRSADRARTVTPGVETLHSFSFGAHYDPANTGHGLLVAHNEDRLAPGGGYPDHPHRDLEIVTWVLSGALRHEDSAGRRGLVEAGSVQRVSAGSGIRHAEWNDAATGPRARFVQMWVLPDRAGTEPSYAQAAAPEDGWVTLASGLGGGGREALVGLGASAALHLSRLAPGGSVVLPAAPHLHVFVAGGSVDLEGAGRLGSGDAARLTGADAGLRLSSAGLLGGAQVLVWELHHRSGSMEA